MTKREAAVIMAISGTCLLAGEDFNVFHQYVESLMNRPVWTHELPALSDEIRIRAYPDFVNICKRLEDDA